MARSGNDSPIINQHKAIKNRTLWSIKWGGPHARKHFLPREDTDHYRLQWTKSFCYKHNSENLPFEESEEKNKLAIIVCIKAPQSISGCVKIQKWIYSYSKENKDQCLLPWCAVLQSQKRLSKRGRTGDNWAIIVLLHTLAQVPHTCTFQWLSTTLSEEIILQSQWLCVIDPRGFLDFISYHWLGGPWPLLFSLENQLSD